MDLDELIIACTLNPDLVRERIEEWQRLVGSADARQSHDAGVLLRFDRKVIDLGQLAALAGAERECCPFFAFTLRIDVDGVSLDVSAPEAARPLVDILVGVDENG